MITICEECGAKYQIEPEKITGERAHFKCKRCSHTITVEKNEFPVELESVDPFEDTSAATAEADAVTEESADDLLMGSATAQRSAAADDIQPLVTEQVPLEVPKGKKKGLHLTGKVILLMLFVSLVPLAIYGGFSYIGTQKELKFTLDEEGGRLVTLGAGEVDAWMSMNMDAMKMAAEQPYIKSMSQFNQEMVLKSLTDQYPWMSLAFTTDLEGHNIARSDGGELLEYADRSYVKDILAGKDVAWQTLISKTTGVPSLVMAVPVTNGDELVGVLGAAMSREDLSEILSIYIFGESSSSFIVDETGKTVAYMDAKKIPQDIDLSSHPLVRASEQQIQHYIEFKDKDGVDSVGFVRKTEMGWTFALAISKDEVFLALDREKNFILMLFGITLVVVVIIAFAAAKALVIPITKVTDAANHISMGHLDIDLKQQNRTDEIGDLAEAVMRMQDSLRYSLARLRQRD